MSLPLSILLGGNMLIKKIKTYKWQALASLVMTSLMVASSLLQPRYLQEVLEALLAGQHEAIYSIGAWFLGDRPFAGPKRQWTRGSNLGEYF